MEGAILQTLYAKGEVRAALLDGHQTRCKKAELNDITHKIAMLLGNGQIDYNIPAKYIIAPECSHKTIIKYCG